MDSSFVSAVMIYLLDDEVIEEPTIEARANEVMKGMQKVAAVPNDLTSDGYHLNTLKKGDKGFMTPDMNLLQNVFSELSNEESMALQKADRAIQIDFFGNKNDICKKQHKINQLVFDITHNRKVIIVDLSTLDFFNVPLWKESRLDPFIEEPLNIASQVAIHTYREDAFCRAVTLGMNKFCLPEISIKDFPCSDQNAFGNLVNATIQTLFENPTINSDSTLHVDLRSIRSLQLREFLLSTCEESAVHSVAIKLKHVEPQEGDNYAPQLLIAFEDNYYSSPQEEANKIITTLFGAEDSIVFTTHNEELLKASDRAKQKLPQLKQQFNGGLAPGYSVMVKIPFKTDRGNNEWMWVEVTKWNKTQMEGILQNDPYEIKNLKAGSLVKFDQSDIFDYLLSKPDGTFEGNETEKILESSSE